MFPLRKHRPSEKHEAVHWKMIPAIKHVHHNWWPKQRPYYTININSNWKKWPYLVNIGMLCSSSKPWSAHIISENSTDKSPQPQKICILQMTNKTSHYYYIILVSIPLASASYLAMPCNTLQYHATPSNTKQYFLAQLFIVTHSFLQDFVTNWLDHSSVSVSLTSRNTCSLFVCFSVPSSTTYIYYIYCILLHFYVEYIYIFYTSSSFNHDDYRDNDKEDDSVFWCQWTQP